MHSTHLINILVCLEEKPINNYYWISNRIYPGRWKLETLVLTKKECPEHRERNSRKTTTLSHGLKFKHSTPMMSLREGMSTFPPVSWWILKRVNDWVTIHVPRKVHVLRRLKNLQRQLNGLRYEFDLHFDMKLRTNNWERTVNDKVGMRCNLWSTTAAFITMHTEVELLLWEMYALNRIGKQIISALKCLSCHSIRVIGRLALTSLTP